MSVIDSHAHVSTPKFDKERAEVLARARSAGLVAIVDVGCDLESSQASAALAAADPMVWASVGVHPHEAKHWDDETPHRLRELSRQERVVAIGEMGLDFHYNHSPPDTQRRVFREQLALAVELDLPAVLHIREAYEESHGILDEQRDPKLRGVAHCFTGNAAQATGFVERGFYVSFTGVVTFKKAKDVQDAATVVPLDRLLVETDCPYMSPVPMRGKRCEPAYVVHTARAIAALRGVPEAVVFEAVTANAARLFGLSVDAG